MNIDHEIDTLIATREGGYANHVNDRGGPTRWGITESVARHNKYQGDMRMFSKIHAKMIYKKMYWIDPGYNVIPEKKIAFKLFDVGVLCGPSFASCCLQRALNMFNSDESHYDDIAVDGITGLKTIFALNEYIRIRGTDGTKQMLKVLNGLQMNRFFEIVEGNPKQEAFFFGWIAKRID